MPPVSLKPPGYHLRDLWEGQMSEGVQERFEEMKRVDNAQDPDTTTRAKPRRLSAKEASKGAD